MKWRNEQIYHLRQSKVLSYKDQNLYFNEIVYKLFYKDNPKQILFSFREQYFGCLWWISSYKLGKKQLNYLLTAAKYKNFALSYYWKIFLNLLKKLHFLI